MRNLKKWFHNHPIRYKLTVAVMGLCFVALTITNLAQIGVQYLFESFELQRELDATLELMERSSRAALDFEDRHGATEALFALRFNEEATHACLYNSQNELFAFYSSGPNHICANRLSDDVSTQSWTSMKWSKRITDNTQYLGTLTLHYSLDSLYLALSYTAAAGFAILLIVLTMTYWATRLVGRLIASPIMHLANTAKEFSTSGAYSLRLTKQHDDEIGTLVDNFNQMLARIEQNDVSIREEKKKVESLNNDLVIATQQADFARKTAERANHLKSEFLANMSHELRTPMNSILGFSRRSIKKLETLSQEQLMENLQLINESGTRLLGLLNDLLDLSKLEAGKMTFEMTPTDLRSCIEKMLREIQSLAHDKRVIIAMEEPHFPVTVECDSIRIGQVVLNMVSNAIKFTPPEKTIHLRFSETEIAKNQGVMKRAIQFTVEDEGAGIPEGELDMVFDKFAQSSKTKSGAGGTGLGLAICKEIIRAHSGRIWAEHGTNGGAVFHFAIPYIQKRTRLETEVAQ